VRQVFRLGFLAFHSCHSSGVSIGLAQSPAGIETPHSHTIPKSENQYSTAGAAFLDSIVSAFFVETIGRGFCRSPPKNSNRKTENNSNTKNAEKTAELFFWIPAGHLGNENLGGNCGGSLAFFSSTSAPARSN
jgi:hypothetical protein